MTDASSTRGKAAGIFLYYVKPKYMSSTPNTLMNSLSMQMKSTMYKYISVGYM